jgi:hypothetical protein
MPATPTPGYIGLITCKEASVSLTKSRRWLQGHSSTLKLELVHGHKEIFRHHNPTWQGWVDQKKTPAKRALALNNILSNPTQAAEIFEQLIPINAFHWKKPMRYPTLAQAILVQSTHLAPNPTTPAPRQRQQRYTRTENNKQNILSQQVNQKNLSINFNINKNHPDSTLQVTANTI